MTHRNEGAKAWRTFRSTTVTRCSPGSRRRSSLATTCPPMPAPRMTMRIASCDALEMPRRGSEPQDSVRPQGPIGELFERASLGAVREFRVGDAACVHARAAHAGVPSVPPDVSQHDFRVVVPLRHLLPFFRAARGISHQEDPHLLALALGQCAGEAKSVVAALGAIGRIVEDEQCRGHESVYRSTGYRLSAPSAAKLLGRMSTRRWVNPMSRSVVKAGRTAGHSARGQHPQY